MQSTGEASASSTPLWFVAHATSSIGLTLVNKWLALRFPHPYAVIFAQNAGSCCLTLLLAAFGVLRVRICTAQDVARAMLSSALLVGICWSNLAGLQYISVPMYVVGRNTVPILTACGETIFLGANVGRSDLVALVVALVGSLLYALGDNTWDARGVHLALFNAVFVTGSTLVEKKLIGISGRTPVEINAYRCLFSLPMLLPLMHFYGESSAAAGTPWLTLLGSCPLAFGIGVASFQLQARVHATSIQAANVAYKVVTTVVSLVLFPLTVTLVGWTGYAVSFFGFVLYMVGRSRRAAKSKSG